MSYINGKYCINLDNTIHVHKKIANSVHALFTNQYVCFKHIPHISRIKCTAKIFWVSGVGTRDVGPSPEGGNDII